MNTSTRSSFFFSCSQIPGQSLEINGSTHPTVGYSRVYQWQPEGFQGAILLDIVQFGDGQNRVSITKQKISSVSEIGIVWGASNSHKLNQNFFSVAPEQHFSLGSPPINYIGLTARVVSLGMKNTHL
ncbi:hypothetical protein G8759_11155 [Spirosoma aureum]|uniref:Uncharacterized protein n=1 Tax=Spirosoma aureum TaxID=2692134 RepID=A0A6G9ALQ8_9BACT|nr:hypothetical protein [Spirosoma aureum]QIP13143.1 hypothetical protein G8759_11155 [Spirosoma aureum]